MGDIFEMVHLQDLELKGQRPNHFHSNMGFHHEGGTTPFYNSLQRRKSKKSPAPKPPTPDQPPKQHSMLVSQHQDQRKQGTNSADSQPASTRNSDNNRRASGSSTVSVLATSTWRNLLKLPQRLRKRCPPMPALCSCTQGGSAPANSSVSPSSKSPERPKGSTILRNKSSTSLRRSVSVNYNGTTSGRGSSGSYLSGLQRSVSLNTGKIKRWSTGSFISNNNNSLKRSSTLGSYYQGSNNESSSQARRFATRSAVLMRNSQNKHRGPGWVLKKVRRKVKKKTSGGSCGGNGRINDFYDDPNLDVSVRWDKMRQQKEKAALKRAESLVKRDVGGFVQRPVSSAPGGAKTVHTAPKDCDVCYKVLMIGDSGVGKTALTRSLIQEEFKPKSLTTVGMDFVTKHMEIDGARIKLQVWDTAGQERFRSMTRFQFRGTQGAILAYDIADKESFLTLKYWLQLIDSEIDQYTKEPIPVFLIGNKSDIPEKRQVPYKKGKQLAEEHLMRGFVETSAKTGKNVDEAFTQLSQAIAEIHHPKLLDSYLDKFEREDKYEQRKKETEVIAQHQLQKQKSRIKLPSSVSRSRSLEMALTKKCCIVS